MTFTTLKTLGQWLPIRDCPGRFVLQGVPPTLTLVDLLGVGAAVRRFQSPKARDPVWVAILEDGAVISYGRPDGTWVHTLNTPEGFGRKLEHLGIELQQ